MAQALRKIGFPIIISPLQTRSPIQNLQISRMVKAHPHPTHLF